jgi:hypothetical protein
MPEHGVDVGGFRAFAEEALADEDNTRVSHAVSFSFIWSENRPRLGARQRPVARQRLRVLGAVVSWPR